MTYTIKNNVSGDILPVSFDSFTGACLYVIRAHRADESVNYTIIGDGLFDGVIPMHDEYTPKFSKHTLSA